MGSVLPVAGASRPAFSLTLYPASVIVPVGRTEVAFNLLNGGSALDHVTVTAAAAWLIPDELAFDLAAGRTHTTRARVALPALHDVGDLSTTLAFSVASSDSQGPLRVSRGVAALLIVATPGAVRHALSWSDLQLPRVVDPLWAAPVRVSVTAHNGGTVHETLDPVLGTVGAFPWGNVTDSNDTVLHFEPAVLLRGTSRALRADWSPPLLCWCTVGVRGLQTSVVVFPWRVSLALLAILGGVVVAVRRRQRAQP